MLKNNGIRMSCSFHRGDETSLPEELEQLSVEIPQREYVEKKEKNAAGSRTYMVKPRGNDRGAVASTKVEHDGTEAEAAPRKDRPDVRLVRAASEPVRDEEDVLPLRDRLTA